VTGVCTITNALVISGGTLNLKGSGAGKVLIGAVIGKTAPIGLTEAEGNLGSLRKGWLRSLRALPRGTIGPSQQVVRLIVIKHAGFGFVPGEAPLQLQ